MDAYMHKYISKTGKQNTSQEQLMTVVIPTQLSTWSYDKKSSTKSFRKTRYTQVTPPQGNKDFSWFDI